MTHTVTRKSDATELPGHWATVAGLKIHYKTAGQGPPLFMLHGGGNDWHEWVANVSFFAQHFCVYVPDLPGYGLSESTDVPVTPQWLTQFVRELVDVLGINSAHFMGHSLGGMIALIFALQYPEKVRKLILVSSAGLGEMGLVGRALLPLLRIMDKLRRQRRGRRHIVGKDRDWEFLDKLPALKRPVLIIWGKNDIYLSPSIARRAQGLIPDCRLHLIPDCGHAPQREQTEEFHKLVYEFLSQHPA